MTTPYTLPVPHITEWSKRGWANCFYAKCPPQDADTTITLYTVAQMDAAFAAGAASRDAELNQAERDYSAKCSELEIVHAECDALRDEIQRQYACINSHAEITFKAEDERDLLRVEVEALRKELREGDDLRNRLAGILTRSVNLIRGEPEPLCLHSWHDLPELIDALRADAESWRNYKARKDAVLAAGMGRNPLRTEAQRKSDAFDSLPDDYEVN